MDISTDHNEKFDAHSSYIATYRLPVSYFLRFWFMFRYFIVRGYVYSIYTSLAQLWYFFFYEDGSCMKYNLDILFSNLEIWFDISVMWSQWFYLKFYIEIQFFF